MTRTEWEAIPVDSAKKEADVAADARELLQLKKTEEDELRSKAKAVFIGLKLRCDVGPLPLFMQSSLLYFTRLGHNVMVLVVVFHVTFIVQS